MKLTHANHSQRGYIQLIIAILVLIIGGIIIYKLARLLSQVLPSGSKTNTSSTYYSTNYGGYLTGLLPTSPLATEGGSSEKSQLTVPSFTLFYGYSSLDNLPWVSLTNAAITVAGQATDLINTSNLYVVSVNLGSYSMVYAYDANTGMQTGSVSNGAVAVVIQKSTNLLDWADIYTNPATVMDAVGSYTDEQAIEDRAFYRARVP